MAFYRTISWLFTRIFSLIGLALVVPLALSALCVFIGSGNTAGRLIACLLGALALLLALNAKQNLRKLDQPEVDKSDRDVPNQPLHSVVSGSFVREADLEKYLVENWTWLDAGFPMEFVGQQIQCGELGVIDILARDKVTRDYVVIELKKKLADDVVLGQISRYMGGIQRNRAAIEGVSVRGVIIARTISSRLRAAVSVNPKVELRQYVWTHKGESRAILANRLKCSPRELLLLNNTSDLRSGNRSRGHFRVFRGITRFFHASGLGLTHFSWVIAKNALFLWVSTRERLRDQNPREK